MPATLASVASLLFGLSLLLAGSGLLGTLLGVRAGLEGFGTRATGIVMSAFYLGWVWGSLHGPLVVRRVGHIRTFAALAALASVAATAHAYLVDPLSWAMLRLVVGFCIAGLFIVVESWLNDRATNTTRGTILGVYMMVSLAALALGQQALMLADPMQVTLFSLAAGLLTFALIPVALTTSVAPTPIRTARLGLKHLWETSPLGLTGSFANGLVIGSFWGMAPVFGVLIGLGTTGVAMFMTATIAGGAVLQWPIGWLSDRFDRRTVITVDCFMIALAAAGVAMVAPDDGWALYVLAGLFGGLGFPLYALCNAHPNDYLEPEDMVEAGSGLLLAYGIGASLGPALASQAMQLLGPEGLYVFAAGVSFLVGAFALWRMTRRPPLPSEEQGPYAPVAQTTAVALELDPRLPGDDDPLAEPASTP
jgi:MFS family permease